MFPSTNNFDKLLDKATSHLLMKPDWPSILQLCDLIRQTDVQPKYALNAVKKKLFSQNHHTVLYALLVLESMVKNCGYPLHEELTTRAFCDTLYKLAKTTPHENVRQKLFKLIQAWNFAFRKNPKHGALKDTMALMKSDGFKFPAFRESDAMFSTDSPPKWADGDVCHRCRIAFGILQRKHHCRACGQVFCHQCTQKTTTLPKYGTEKEVRVCDACYDQATKPSAKGPVTDRSPSPVEEQSNPELSRYLNRSYWESINQNESNEVRATSPSAPVTESKPKNKENGVVDNDLEDFITTLKSQVKIFINQMKSNSSRGRSIANDTTVQTLLMNVTAMHSKLLRYIQQHDDSRLHFQRLRDKLTQVKDARAALDDLRDEHREKLRREAEEAERQRQLQMAPTAPTTIHGRVVFEYFNSSVAPHTQVLPSTSDDELREKEEANERFSVHTEKRSSLNTLNVGELPDNHMGRIEKTRSEEIKWDDKNELYETVSDEKSSTSMKNEATSPSTNKIKKDDKSLGQFIISKLNEITDEAVRVDVEQKIIQLLYDSIIQCQKNAWILLM